MNRALNNKIVIILLFAFNISFAQIKEYFPMHVGDYWQYTVSSWGSVESYFDVTTVEVERLKDYSVIATLKYGINQYEYYKIVSNDTLTLYHSSSKYGNYTPECKIYLKPHEILCGSSNYWTRLDTNYYRQIFSDVYDTTYIFASSGDSTFTPYASVYYGYARGFGKNFWGADFAWVGLNGCIIDGITYGTIVGVEDEITPIDYTLKINNYPNPFNPSTTINYTIPQNEFTKITIYDMLGREIEVLINGYQNAGTHSVNWSPKEVSSGVYLAVIKYKNQTLTQKMIYQK